MLNLAYGKISMTDKVFCLEFVICLFLGAWNLFPSSIIHNPLSSICRWANFEFVNLLIF